MAVHYPKNKRKKKSQPSQLTEEKGIAAPEPINFEEKVIEQNEETHKATVNNLIMNCRLVRYTVSWFSKTKKVSKNAKSQMVGVVNGKSEGYSASKRLLSSSHDAMKKLNEAKRKLDECRNAYTVVKTTVAQNDSVEVQGGVRLICLKDIEEFDREFQTHVEELMQEAKNVQLALPEIKALDRKRLGTEFNDDDYPADIGTEIAVNGPFYSQFVLDTKLPKVIYERQEQLLAEEINGSVVGASNYISNELINAFDDLARQLVSRHTVHPTDADYTHLNGGELLGVSRNRNNPSIQEGYVLATISMNESEGIKKKKVSYEVGPMKEEDFNRIFIPTPTSDNRKLYDSTFDKVLGWLENFNRIKGTIGNYGDQMDNGLNLLRTKLSEISKYSQGKSTSAMTDLVKENNVIRQQLAESLNEAVANLQATTVSVQRSARRNINFNVELE